MKQLSVGVIGCGNICGTYFKNMPAFPVLRVQACADIDMTKASAKAEEFGITAMTVDKLLADPTIDIILNLTIPRVHAEIALRAITAGKHVYNEKPLAIAREDAQQVLAAAAAKGVRVGCAPDTVLGGAHQTCRKVIADGWIGTPVAVAGFMLRGGPERWHPNPDFFYEVGGGPLFDMGPYYLTAMISFLGSVRRVTGSAQISRPERIATAPSNFGARIPVHTPTHIASVLDFAAGGVGTIIMSFDTPGGGSLPFMEIYGTEGTLTIPDPNFFGGVPRIRRIGENEFSDIPLIYNYTDNERGLGVADMATAIITGRAHRANGEIAYHVLDIMHAIHDSSHTGKHVDMTSSVTRPSAMEIDLPVGVLD
ncbi:MAG: Gfo/Idh/MocA family oxidoreductase [bacterium]